MSGASAAACARLGPDRWHFQHGPIDLIIDVEADADSGERAIADCWRQFQGVLPALVEELPELRRPLNGQPALGPVASCEPMAPSEPMALDGPLALRGPVAQRMLRACAPFADERFITPMAAVAGAVADELIATFSRPGVTRACINNGGDIALLLSPGASYRVGICPQLEGRVAPWVHGVPLGSVFTVREDAPVRGIATSGWRGRSFSFGVADSVTVLAATAAAADAAATLIANAVNCDHPGIVRTPADQLKDDTDLGALPVTVDVPPLPATLIAAALASGRVEAERWRDRGLIHAAAMFLQGQVEFVLPRLELQPEEGGAAPQSRAALFEPARVGPASMEPAAVLPTAVETAAA
jgi:ApbE superfamily uncharacterized protein (UPF0280 family)